MAQLTTQPNPLSPNTGATTAPVQGQAPEPLLPTTPAPLTSRVQSNQSLEPLRRNAEEAIRTGDYAEITATNPTLGTFLRTLQSSGLSKDNQINVLDSMLDLAEKWSDPFSPSSLARTNDRNIVQGLNPNNMTTQDAIKLAAGIGAAIVAQAAENARLEQEKMRQIQARIGEIPANIKETVLAKYDLRTMNPDQIIAAVNREMEANRNKKQFGNTATATSDQDAATA